MEKFTPIQWPEIQIYMSHKEFRDNAYLINDEKGIEDYGSSAYFVNTCWKEKIDKITEENL